MSSGTWRGRIVAEVAFFACLFAGFYWESTGNFFCNEVSGTARSLQTLHIASILTAWDSLACVFGIAMARWLRNAAPENAARLWMSGAVAGIGYFSAPFVLFPWNEEHAFHNLFNCSCFFTEGYGMMFPLLTAPVLTFGTLLREGLTQRFLTRESRKLTSE